MVWRILATVLFAIIMFGVWKWAHFVSDNGHWFLWLATMLVIAGVAVWFDKRDGLY
jgi:hypothetical protein